MHPLNQLYLDQLLTWLIIIPLKVLAHIGLFFEKVVIDAFLTAVAWIPGLIGRVLRPLQNGLVSSYAVVMLLGLAAILVATLVRF